MNEDCYVAVPKSHLKHCVETIINYVSHGSARTINMTEIVGACEMLTNAAEGPCVAEVQAMEKALRGHIENLQRLSELTRRLMWFQSTGVMAACALNVAVFIAYGASFWAYASQVLAFTAIGIMTLRARKSDARHRQRNLRKD
jgi:hypothetical protein